MTQTFPISLEGKVALVGGASAGIGRAVARQLASLGARVILAARNQAALDLLVKDLPNNGHLTMAVDYSNTEALEVGIDRLLQDLGGPVHILVNNTGGPPPGQAISATAEAFTLAFNAHLIANHTLATALIPSMKHERYGRIINIISTSVKQPIPNLGVSNTIRAAVANWSKTLSLELGPFGITVNNVLPGATYTGRLQNIIGNRSTKSGRTSDEEERHMLDEIPLDRFALPEEIAYAVAFLASPAGAYISGINLPVDGGRTASL